MTDRTTNAPTPDEPADTGHETGHGRENQPGPVRERLSAVRERLHANPATSLATKIVVAVVGGLVAALGVVMIVTPGPAFVLIPLGLAILATEFTFARRWLEKARDQARRAKERAEQMDPKVRRRRMLIGAVAVLALVAGVATYVWAYDWPTAAVDGWDWVQGLAGWVPDLPGM